MKYLRRQRNTAPLVALALILASFSIPSVLARGPLTLNMPQTTLTVSGQVIGTNGAPVANVTITITVNRMGTFETITRTTDAGGNYSTESIECANNIEVRPSKAGLAFTPQSINFVSTTTICGSQTASFTVIPPVAISQIYTGGGEPGATFTNDFVELFNLESFRVSAPISTAPLPRRSYGPNTAVELAAV